ncbi:MAG TPA: 2-phospho-L-lactate guanylyltransferase [bacterium]|nr:2-phospho-L-lactate guanylyltransferase [bacterium]
MTAPESIAILVPVKDLSRAKSRLSPLLTLDERRELAWLLLQGTLRTIAAASAPGPRGLITNYPPAISLGRSLGFAIIEETQQISESASVDAASAQLERNGATGVLRIPLDLPVLAPDDLAPVLEAACSGAEAVLVPARDRLGTNALYRSPPTLFSSRFGPDSLTLHEQAARAVATDVRVLPIEGFALDIDDPQDVSELVRRAPACPGLDYLRSLDITTRLERMAREPA